MYLRRAYGMDFASFGEQVRKRRIEEGMSQEELAKKAGVSRVYISLIERGQAQNLSWSVVSGLTTALGIRTSNDSPDGPSTELSDEEEQRMPATLRAFVSNSKQPVPAEDVRMLMRLQYRGKQPATEEEWRLLYTMIRSIIDRE